MYSGTLSGCCIRTSLSRAQYYQQTLTDAKLRDNDAEKRAHTERDAFGRVKYTPLEPYDLDKTEFGAKSNIIGMQEVSRDDDDDDDDSLVKVQAPAWAEYAEGGDELPCVGACAVLKGCAIADIVQADDGIFVYACVCVYMCVCVCVCCFERMCDCGYCAGR